RSTAACCSRMYCTLTAVITAMPLCRISSTSCQRSGLRLPGGLLNDSWSMRQTSGWRRKMAGRSMAPSTVGIISRWETISRTAPGTSFCAAAITTSWPRSLRRRPSSNMRNDLPTRGAYPRKILRRPRRSRRSSAWTRRSNSSGLGLRSARGVTMSRIILCGAGNLACGPDFQRVQAPAESRRQPGLAAPQAESFLWRGGGVEGEVQLQPVDAGFAQNAQLAVLGIGGYQLAESVGGHAAGGGHAGHL